MTMTHVYEIWDDEKRETHRMAATISDAEKLAGLLNTYYSNDSAHIQPRFTVHSHVIIARGDIDGLGDWMDRQAEIDAWS